MGRSLTRERWRRLVQGTERTLPYYDLVNEIISLRAAGRARREAVRDAQVTPGMLVVDAGVGPGTLAEQVLQYGPSLLIGVDVSRRMLHLASSRLKGSERSEVHLVRAAFEALPFPSDIFDRVFASFALRDSFDRDASITEFYRLCKPSGCLTLVDMGRPDGKLTSLLVGFYIQSVMPLVAKLILGLRVEGNPWRILAETYDTLEPNRGLFQALSRAFGRASMRRYLLGGIVAIRAEKAPRSMPGSC